MDESDLYLGNFFEFYLWVGIEDPEEAYLWFEEYLYAAINGVWEE